MFGPRGQKLLDEMPFDGAYTIRVASLRDVVEIHEREPTIVSRKLHRRPKTDPYTPRVRPVERLLDPAQRRRTLDRCLCPRT